MAQDFDKIFREVLKDIFPVVAQKVIGIPQGDYKPLPGDLQYTSEREADQIWEVIPQTGLPFILHCEFQTSNDKQMLSRMLLYYAFLYYQKKLPIRQYVIYIGREAMKMDYQLQSEKLTYSYELIDLRTYPYQLFLESSSSREVLLAILADFGGEPGGLIVERIIAKLEQVCISKLELSQRALQLLRLAVLRNLNHTVFTLAKKMAISIDIKEDTLYQEGLQKGQEEGKVAAREDAAVNMLKKGMATELISEITQLPVERVVQLRQQLEAGE